MEKVRICGILREMWKLCGLNLLEILESYIESNPVLLFRTQALHSPRTPNPFDKAYFVNFYN